MLGPDLKTRTDQRLRHAIAEEERSAFALMTKLRAGAMGAIVIYVFAQFPVGMAMYWAGIATALALIGLGQYAVIRSRWRNSWQKYLFVVFDSILVAYALLYLNPMAPDPWPIQTQLRLHTFPFFFLFLALTALTYAPLLVLASGIGSAVAWSVGNILIIARPETLTVFDLPAGQAVRGGPEMLALFLKPTFVHVNNLVVEVLVLLITTAILATAVARSVVLMRRQIAAERERSNLARYFSPTMVDELAKMDQPLSMVRQQHAAVLFADIVGFTAIAERQSPAATIDMLREFHARMAAAIFGNGGTVDKYIGDCVMATFGTPHAGANDASNAFKCALAMVTAMEDWNRLRALSREPSLRIGIGLHYGPVVLGDIGDERRLEFAVIGDTVNVAARLEALTRKHDVDLLASEDLVERARLEIGLESTLLANLTPGGKISVYGRAADVNAFAILRKAA
ncbi:MAG: adenylate/guanylate cyclase domain-containing protein [Alphaproteobacteria bacterium]